MKTSEGSHQAPRKLQNVLFNSIKMETEIIEFPVIIKETDEVITLFLNKETAARASEDQQFLQKLISEHNNASVLSTLTENAQEQKADESSSKSFIWPDAVVFLLIDLYREKEHQFTSGNKRHDAIWKGIAAQIRETNAEYIVTGLQCSTKFAGLKRTYKNVCEQNKKSGNCRNSWAFFSAMDSLIGNKAYIKPPAEASSDGPSPPKSLMAPSSSGCLSLPLENVQSVHKKRRVEQILENYIDDIRHNREIREKKQEEEKKQRKEEKKAMYEERKEERARMYKENLEVQKSILTALEALINKK